MVKSFSNIRVIVIGGSAGSFPVMGEIFSQLPKNYRHPIVVASHRLKHVRKGFVQALALKSNLPLIEPLDKEKIEPGKIYLAPANYHLSLEPNMLFSLSTEEMLWSSRPSIDITLASVGEVYNKQTLGVLLTGANKDGAFGMKKINDFGGITVVQDPATCLVDTMPKSAMEITKIDHVMKVDEIIKLLINLNR